MNRKLVLLYVLTVLLTFTFSMSLRVQVAEASGTIYIRADGSIDPPTAPIQRKGDIYTLTGNITSDTDAIVIERNNMIFNGAGYTVQGTGGGFGILLSETRNVRIRNTQVKGFTYGIFLRAPQFSSSNCTITENNITSNGGGVSLTSYFNILSVNNITKNQGPAVTLFYSHYTKIQGNNISDNWDGLQIESSENCIVSGNKITKNGVGVLLYRSSHNLICNNNFVNNMKHVHDISWDYPSISPSINFWDNGYPSGGNYWSDHNPPDIYTGPYQNETGSDKIGDVPYIIDENNTDRYPLIYPFGYVPSPDLDNDGIVDIFDLVRIALAYGSIPGIPIWKPYIDLNQDSIIDIFDLVIIAIHYGEHW